MKIGVLTSSRADYSIYYPLLKELQNDTFFDVSIIAFGTHLSEKHGYTIKQIENDGFDVPYRIPTLGESDSPYSISCSIAGTVKSFAELWETEKFDLVFCLGDRYEMFAACVAGIPFNVRFAHIHGGEKTLGAIDEVFRHSLTLMANLHFTAAEPYAKRVAELKETNENVYNVGSLSIDNLSNLSFLSISEFKERFGIDISKPSILITFHPETVSFQKNEQNVDELIEALDLVTGYQFIITMPNADTMGNLIREKLQNFIAKSTSAIGVESFGTLGYLSCMKHCSFMLGNTSSGFIEASYFPKYVINIGIRQKGRIITPNIRSIEISKNAILASIEQYQNTYLYTNENVYGDGTTALKIVEILKKGK
jgi:GDP/UDP-N,N'-diacetylbacillosamine 2-epimerase (hydrolysing)